MRPIDLGPFHVERLPDGSIEAPDRYLEYEGQVIVRTPHGTSQRFIDEGWDEKRRGPMPYILGKSCCTGEKSEYLKHRNDHLELNEFSVYYVSDSEHVLYRVIEE